MGIYFNPTNESFQQTVRSHVYVDKTGLIKELNKRIGTEDKCVAVSHARRFGKSQAAGMVDAYYSLGSDSKEFFCNCCGDYLFTGLTDDNGKLLPGRENIWIIAVVGKWIL